jgi:hypothetical protein
MANEEIMTNEQTDNSVYIQTIQELKENSVDRKIYDKLKGERDMLIKSLANGDVLATAENGKVRSLADCKADFLTKTTSQCEYIEKVLALRDAAMREGHSDPFVAEGHHVKPTAYDYQRAQEIADIYRECLDYAEGDDQVFMNEINRRIR